VRWKVRVANRADSVRTLKFATGQRADVILRSAGVVRYRWSAGRFFVEIIGERRLSPGESAAFVLTDELLVRSGRYQLVARVTANPALAPSASRRRRPSALGIARQRIST
jgi:hypothetical protein